jgi:hypothetical protein
VQKPRAELVAERIGLGCLTTLSLLELVAAP